MPGKTRKRRRRKPGSLMRKVRKPMAPPAKVEDDRRKYKRARERERLRNTGVQGV